MNIGVHVSLSDLVSSVCMPRSGIAGSYGKLSLFADDMILYIENPKKTLPENY